MGKGGRMSKVASFIGGGQRPTILEAVEGSLTQGALCQGANGWEVTNIVPALLLSSKVLHTYISLLNVGIIFRAHGAGRKWSPVRRQSKRALDKRSQTVAALTDNDECHSTNTYTLYGGFSGGIARELSTLLHD